MTVQPASGEVTVSVSIDTEEDNWGSYDPHDASTKNIAELPSLQAVFETWGARPTYLVNHPPLLDAASVTVLAGLAARDDVEIGAHCHPWNTPPYEGGGAARSMMCTLPAERNRVMLANVRGRIESELGVRPTTFRAGRWGFGPSVAVPLAQEGFEVDCSVSPFVDWSADGGPDYGDAPHAPYRFDPNRPLTIDSSGSLVELPTTVGFLSGDHRRRGRLRRSLERSVASRLKIVGLLDSLGWLAKRWLSPETSSSREMIRLAEAYVRSGETFLQLTFHSCTLLPGATPFVRSDSDRTRFLRAVEDFLRFCQESGFVFRTLSEASGSLDLSGD